MDAYNLQIAKARAYFPRGLTQPQGSFRFSLDAVLLAAYAARMCPNWLKMADLGCGAGAVPLGLMLLTEDFLRAPCAYESEHCFQITSKDLELLEPSGQKVNLKDRSALGVDMHAELLDAALENAERLGFSNVFSVCRADLQADCTVPMLGERAGSCDLVTANPPYRLPNSGRLPQSPLRRDALFGNAENLQSFVSAAYTLLAPEGSFCLIFPMARLNELKHMLVASKFYLSNLLPVITKAGAAPGLALITARKGEVNKLLACSEQKPLAVYTENSEGKRCFSQGALEFCRFLDSEDR